MDYVILGYLLYPPSSSLISLAFLYYIPHADIHTYVHTSRVCFVPPPLSSFTRTQGQMKNLTQAKPLDNFNFFFCNKTSLKAQMYNLNGTHHTNETETNSPLSSPFRVQNT